MNPQEDAEHEARGCKMGRTYQYYSAPGSFLQQKAAIR